ncbi:MAG: D-alanyl-D-alanine carboxypeptidase/D-alanyl-D-alanine-endopeptidase [Simkaniaceae bacterium]|nr:D-alanyl-D-alanine carboxypeptidase/D-alanyl-D-alanine-endopeptidase [Simkaniaceae bacterium]
MIFPLLLSSIALVIDTMSGEAVLEKSSSDTMSPASCMKIVTTGAALGMLGRNYRFETKLMHDGLVKDGILQGNLYIVGSGDPTLGDARYSGWKKQISDWQKALADFGIQKISGKVIGDASLWDENLIEPSWLVEDIGNYYGAGACALNFHCNSYTLTFRPGKNIGEITSIVETDPPNLGFTLENLVTTGPVNSGDQACIYSHDMTVRGTIPAGVTTFSIRGALRDPANTCAMLLSRAVDAQEKPFPTSDRKLIHTHHSPPLYEIVKTTNQKSDNIYAEALFKACGKSTSITNYWKSMGIDTTSCIIADGSGLSLKNSLTPKALVAMLQTLRSNQDFVASLQTRKEGIQAKTGSSSTQACLAGYYNGKTFAIFTQNSGMKLTDLDTFITTLNRTPCLRALK